ncbi:PREDICTED: alpha-1B adrenergic receptor-like [Priapulus caudatus]|uniref:Alpha-1B adrenergic receptor-like n=1 Tax=Priapulus caudatus TaxID=37621 RepID=A0ABM1EMQ0_PRICU|nr:PREDICTED: alpha-1B adrenergic receptor-like [Priapulus caudatus]
MATGNRSLGNGSTDDVAALATSGDVALAALVGALVVCVILLSVVSNCVVLLTVYVEPSLRVAASAYIVSLALADLLIAALVLPLPLPAAGRALGDRLLGPHYCLAWSVLNALCCAASSWSVVVISIYRYLAISRALQYPHGCTMRTSVVVIAGVWILSAAISLPPLFGFGIRFLLLL